MAKQSDSYYVLRARSKIPDLAGVLQPVSGDVSERVQIVRYA
jgi:hypothetical protein